MAKLDAGRWMPAGSKVKWMAAVSQFTIRQTGRRAWVPSIDDVVIFGLSYTRCCRMEC